MATALVARSVVSSFLPEDIPTKPHWSLYVCGATATVAVIAALVAYNFNLLAFAGIFSALSGTLMLSGFYLYRFSRDHAIVVAGRAQREALKDIQETIGEERQTLDQMKGLVEQLKDEKFATAYAKKAEETKKVAADLVATVNKYREMQEQSLKKTKRYTDQVVSQLKAHNLTLTVTNKKGQDLLEQVAQFEESGKATALQLDALLAEREKGTDILQAVQERLQEDVRWMRKMARVNNRLVEGLLQQVERLKAAEDTQNASIQKLEQDLLAAEEQGKRVEAQLQRLVVAKAARGAIQNQGGEK